MMLLGRPISRCLSFPLREVYSDAGSTNGSRDGPAWAYEAMQRCVWRRGARRRITSRRDNVERLVGFIMTSEERDSPLTRSMKE